MLNESGEVRATFAIDAIRDEIAASLARSGYVLHADDTITKKMPAPLPTRCDLAGLFAGAAMAGVALTVAPALATPAADTDAALLAACAHYHRAHAKWMKPWASDKRSDALNDLRQNAMEAVVAIQANTPAGLQAKAAVAYSAIVFDTDVWTGAPWREQATPEQTLALDALAGLMGREQGA